jgi:hypothetical protein
METVDGRKALELILLIFSFAIWLIPFPILLIVACEYLRQFRTLSLPGISLI